MKLLYELADEYFGRFFCNESMISITSPIYRYIADSLFKCSIIFRPLISVSVGRFPAGGP
jgi:hypothetical protein